MRKLKIYNGSLPETSLTLRLVNDGKGGVSIAAVNAKGGVEYGGYLITIAANGHLEIPNNISSGHGFPLDSEGRLKLRYPLGKHTV